MNTPTNQHQPAGTSEYRGSQFSNQTESNISTKSYSHAAQLDASPTNDQAIIIHAIDDTSLQGYALAIGKLIGPKSIMYISKISNNRICAYLVKEEIVLHLTNLHKTITVNNNALNLRPMLTPAQRIILSNISPVIPNSEFEKNLQKKQRQAMLQNINSESRNDRPGIHPHPQFQKTGIH